MVKEPKKIIMGGPMMGRTITNIDCPIHKANNAIVAPVSYTHLCPASPSPSSFPR